MYFDPVLCLRRQTVSKCSQKPRRLRLDLKACHYYFSASRIHFSLFIDVNHIYEKIAVLLAPRRCWSTCRRTSTPFFLGGSSEDLPRSTRPFLKGVRHTKTVSLSVNRLGFFCCVPICFPPFVVAKVDGTPKNTLFLGSLARNSDGRSCLFSVSEGSETEWKPRF